MPRGFRVDHQETSLSRLEGANPRLLDPRSFLSKEKVTPHTNGEAKTHFMLYGADKSAMRAEIFVASRESNSGVPRCWNCRERVYEYGNGPDVGHWHHISNKAGERCDCRDNGAVLCAACHHKEHIQVMVPRV